MSALALATLLALGGNARADGFYWRGDANCDVALSAADVVAEGRTLGGASVCINDDSDRDGSITAADASCTIGCLFGPCPTPPNAPQITAVNAYSALDLVPASVVHVTGTNLSSPDRLTRVTIGGLDAEVVDVSSANDLLVAVPGSLAPGPADVVVFVGDIAGVAWTITIAAPVPLGPPDTFDGTFDLLDTATVKLLALDLESAYGDQAAFLREALQQFRTELATQRAALATDPTFTADVRAQLDAAFDSSGAPELLRQLIASLGGGAAASATRGGAADATIVAAVGKWGRTIKVVRGVGAAAGVTLSAPAWIAIGIAAAIAGGAILVASDPLTPLIFALTFTDALGSPRAYPTAGGTVTINGARFDRYTTELVMRTQAGELFGALQDAGGGLVKVPLPDAPGFCGRVMFSLTRTKSDIRSNPVPSSVQPELLDLSVAAAKPGYGVRMDSRGVRWCDANVSLTPEVGQEWTSAVRWATDGRPSFLVSDSWAPDNYQVKVKVANVFSREAKPLRIAGAVTGLRITCINTTLNVDPGEPSTTSCIAAALPDGAEIPSGYTPKWSSSSSSAKVDGSGDTTISAVRPGTASITASLSLPERTFTSNAVTITVNDITPPKVSITSAPPPGEVAPGSSIVVTAQASDNVALANVRLTATGDAVTNASQETLECVGQKTCSPSFTVSLKSEGFTQPQVTIQAEALDASLNSGKSNQLTFTIKQPKDETCPQITIQPIDGGTVNAGATVQVAAQATDNGPNDTGVSGFHYSASGDALTANVSQDLPLPQPQTAPTLRFAFTVKEAVDLVTVTDKTITISVQASDAATPPNTCSQTITVTAIGTLDQCDGAISADPQSGYDGDSVTITVVISGPAADAVKRVATVNPGGEFELQPQGNGTFQITLYYGGQGPFTLTFTAYDASDNALCSGSIGLTALGPRPGSGASARSDGEPPAGARP